MECPGDTAVQGRIGVAENDPTKFSYCGEVPERSTRSGDAGAGHIHSRTSTGITVSYA